MIIPVMVLTSTLTVLGEILIGIAVLCVHRRMMREKRIDRKVVTQIQHEQVLVIAGLCLLIAGFVLDIA